MPRLPVVSEELATPEVRRIYRLMRELVGRVPNSFKTVAHSPGVLKWFLPFVAVLTREGEESVLDTRTKELAILKTSMLNRCAY